MTEYAGRVGILGCGPAGLAAAHAAARMGYEPIVFSRKVKSTLYGSQYLHQPIPGITQSGAVNVTYRLDGGSYEDYQRKVYGRTVPPSSEPDQENEFAQTGRVTRHAWDIRQTYDDLWDRYSPYVQDLEFGRFRDTSYVLHGMGRMVKVYSTIPRPLLCLYPHTHRFHYAEAWAAGEAPDLGIVLLRDDPGAPTFYPYHIVFHAGPDVPYYRSHNVFGHRTIEWPYAHGKPADYPTASVVKKPLGTDCDCWPQITKLGRYGAWDKSQLVNHAYSRVVADLTALELES